MRNRKKLLDMLREMARLSGVEAKLAALAGEVDLHVVWVSERRISGLNSRFLGHVGPTDVLAFDLCAAVPGTVPLTQEPVAGGEIYVCPAVALRAAETWRTTPEFELALYMVHGMLHLAGEDDLDANSRRRMRRREARIMRQLPEARRLREVFCFGRPGAAARQNRQGG